MREQTTENINAAAIKDRAVRAALDLARFQGWRNTSLSAIAAKADIPLASLRDYFDDRSDILAAYERMIDRRVLENYEGQTSEGAAPRDRLFDVLMDRFDILNEDREALCAIIGDLPRDPKQALMALPFLPRSMNWMMEAAGLSTGGARGAAKLAGLCLIYLKALWVWSRDDSPDMGKTMAALDQGLDKAERWGGMLGLLR